MKLLSFFSWFAFLQLARQAASHETTDECSCRIIDFMTWDADQDIWSHVEEIADDKKFFETNFKLNFEAQVRCEDGSEPDYVKLWLDGPVSATRKENHYPYFVFGDYPPEPPYDPNGRTLPPGNYHIEAKINGNECGSLEKNFEVLPTPTSCPCFTEADLAALPFGAPGDWVKSIRDGNRNSWQSKHFLNGDEYDRVYVATFKDGEPSFPQDFNECSLYWGHCTAAGCETIVENSGGDNRFHAPDVLEECEAMLIAAGNERGFYCFLPDAGLPCSQEETLI